MRFAMALLDAVVPVVSLSVAVACVASTLLESAAPDSVIIKTIGACERMFPLCTTCVTFSLGFFVSTSYSRWWKLRDLAGTVTGRTIDTRVMICTYLNGAHDSARAGRRELARHLLLAHALSLQSGHNAYRFETLVELGLLKADGAELHALQHASTARYNIAYQWLLSSFLTQLPDDDRARGNIVQLMQNNVSSMRGSAADILMYLQERMPRPIVFIAEAVTIAYCAVIAPIALATQLRWYAPLCAAALACFFYGLAACAAAMQDPFQMRLCGFDTAAFLKTTQTACDDLLALRADVSGAIAKAEPAERLDRRFRSWQDLSFAARPSLAQVQSTRGEKKTN
jgi:predicted membrane chloride channel (bestrophin family)